MLYEKLVQACTDGNLSEFEDLWQSYKVDATTQKEVLEHDNFKLFHLVIASGNVDLLDKMGRLLCEISDEGWPYIEVLNIPFTARDGEGFREALIHKKNAMVKAILGDEFLEQKCLEIINERVEFIAYVSNEPSLAYVLHYLFNDACATGVEAILQLEKVLTRDQIITFLLPDNNTELFYAPTSSFESVNEAIVIKHLWNLLNAKEKARAANEVFPKCLILCAKIGNAKLIDAILQLLDKAQQRECLQFEDYNTFVYAADKGHVEVMRLVWDYLDNDGKSAALKASNNAAYRLAKQSNHVEAIAFLEALRK